MTDFLIRTFIKNKDDIYDPEVRSAYGTLSSITGIVCNILLFICKFLLGILSHSISITSDAFNNLSDCISCFVTLFGYRLAEKPADKDHPFGHGRYEYMVSIFIAVAIFFVGYQLFVASFKKIVHPETITFNIYVIMGLVMSILVKLWMSRFNKKLGQKTSNNTMMATSKDSLNDCLTTTATLFSVLVSPFFIIDGYVGIIVSLLILKSGYDILMETIDTLLGKPADSEMVESLKKIFQEDPKILGFHDLIIHDYGPGKKIGSCHVEVDVNESFIDAHDIVDELERRIYHELHIIMTLHMDPVDYTDEKTHYYKELITNYLKELDDNLSLHDFRIVSGPTHTNLVFDVLIPYNCQYNGKAIKTYLDSKLALLDEKCYTVITFDHSFAG